MTTTGIDTPAPAGEPRSATRAHYAAEGAATTIRAIDRRLAELASERRAQRMSRAAGDSEAVTRLAAIDAEVERLQVRRDVAELAGAQAERRYRVAMSGPDAAREARLHRLRQEEAAALAEVETALEVARAAGVRYCRLAAASHVIAVQLDVAPRTPLAPAVAQLRERLQEFAEAVIPAAEMAPTLHAVVVAIGTGQRVA